MATKRQKRKQDRERMRRLRAKRSDAGMKSITVTLPSPIYDLLIKMRDDQGSTFGMVIAQGIVDLAKKREADRDKGAGFSQGDRAKINNPKSKHHGKTMEVTGYSDKYDVVRGKIEGEYVDFKVDFLEHQKLSKD